MIVHNSPSNVGEKACICCKQLMPVGNYYRHGQMADGRLNKCEDCCKRQASEYGIYRNRLGGLEYGSVPFLTKKCRKCGEIKPIDEFHYRAGGRFNRRADCCTCNNGQFKGRPQNKTAKAKWAEQNKHKRLAQNLLNNAVRDKRLAKPTCCSVCGVGGRIHGHHNDYSKPLKVVWVCPVCHGRIHRKRIVPATHFEG